MQDEIWNHIRAMEEERLANASEIESMDTTTTTTTSTTANGSCSHHLLLQLLDEEALLELEQDIYGMIESWLDENPTMIAHERYLDRLVEDVTIDVYPMVLAMMTTTTTTTMPDDADDNNKENVPQNPESDQDMDDTNLYDELADFVADRVDVYVTTIQDIPRIYKDTDEGDDDGAAVAHTDAIMEIRDRIARLQAMPQPPQRTQAWYEFRHTLLTATDIGKLLSSDTPANRNAVIYKKCKPLDGAAMEDEIRIGRVNTQSPMHWGQRYEPVTLMLYEQRYRTHVGEFGCLRHATIACIGASPDGINIDPANPSRYGRLVEIKNVVSRPITGNPLTAYWIQAQIQMEVCDLDKCDFVETEFKEYATWEEVINNCPDAHATLPRGIILWFTEGGDGGGGGGGAPIYRYMPLHIPLTEEAIRAWIQDQENQMRPHTLYRIIGWWLQTFSCVVIPRNRAWFAASLPQIQETWSLIEQERVSGYDHRTPKRRIIGPLIAIKLDHDEEGEIVK
jgi:YqaJ-like viral recombinase domain